MELLTLLKQRYSVRDFAPTPVESELLDKILEAGRVAPTAANFQPQRTIVVQSAEGLKKIDDACNRYFAPLVLIVCADTRECWARQMYDNHKMTDIDASIVTDHMMLQATELGIGSVWICKFDPEKIRQGFELPSTVEPVNILALGYASENAKPSPRHTDRKEIEQTVCYEKYNF